MTWKLEWCARWFVTATLLVAAACSGTAAESPPDNSLQASPSVEGGLTSLELNIVGDSDHPGYAVDIPQGWSSFGGGFAVKEGPAALGMSVWDVGEVPSHPCQWKGSEADPGPTVDDLAGALASQRLRGPSRPTPVTLAGYEGQYLELTVPNEWIVTGDSNFKGCDDPGNGNQDFVSWWGTDSGERYQQAAGQVDHVWILDVEGQTLLVDATYTPDTSAADRRELEEVVMSVRFAEE